MTHRNDRYHGIISQSGGGISDYSTLAAVEDSTGVQFMDAVGCTTLECARAKSWEDCVDSGVGRSQPVVDLKGILPLQPLTALRVRRRHAFCLLFIVDYSFVMVI